MDTTEKEFETAEFSLDDILNSIPPKEIDNNTDNSDFDNSILQENLNNNLEQNQSSDDISDNDVNTNQENMDTTDVLIDSSETVITNEDNEAISNEDDEIPADRYIHTKKRRKKHGFRRFIFGLFLTMIIVGVSVFLALTILKYSKEFLGIDKSDVVVTIEIPYGVNTTEIADILYNEGIIEEVNLFRIFSKIKGTDGSYVSGIHKFSPKMSYDDMVTELITGAEEVRETADVTFPEGITLIEAAERLEESGVCAADEFIKAFNNSTFGFDFEELVKVNSMKFYKMEGYLFPDTYTFYLEEDPRVVVKKIYKNFEAKITPDLYGRMKDLDMTLEEVLTLSSIVQAEAAYKSDMKMVASVFLNRLNNSSEYPLLQSDPTTKYVNEVIKPNIEINSKAMFTAYDTYQGAGLTPGPICNPGIEAINAVLYPAETDYYYFCSNIDTGEFFYAKTLSQHEANLVEAGLV